MHSQNVGDVSMPKNNASTRRVADSGGRPSRRLLAKANPGLQCLHAVWGYPLNQTRAPLTSLAVQFLDESNEIRSQYSDDAYYPFHSPPAAPGFSPQAHSSISGGTHTDTPPASVITPTEGLTVLSLLNSDSPAQTHTSGITPPFDHHVQPNTSEPNESRTFVYQQTPGEPILWPLEHEQEAMLLQHYIENVALFVSILGPINFDPAHHR